MHGLLCKVYMGDGGCVNVVGANGRVIKSRENELDGVVASYRIDLTSCFDF